MSQEYTPVDWVDETPNTPGTLINKARLDQMQTAHHYADGFEEVDAVPTVDPGVDYHKVVFCTADTTFYRWDGSAWVKDVDDTTKALLEAHEADHANPHVVTKAQVGLGNCDNTSDADKPVSTAQQTALDGKVAIIPVTSGVKFYSQSSGGTSLYQGTSSPVTGITSVPLRDSSGRIKTSAPSADDDTANKKYVDDADALKLNSSALVSAWQGTPDNDHIPTEKLVSNTLATKVDKLTTTGTYAYTHASGTQGEIAINGGAVASTLALRDANAYLTAATNATGTKDNVLTTGTRVQNDLDNYSPMVRTTGNQSISGVKTFNSYIHGITDYQRYASAGTNGGKWIKVGSVASNQTAFSMTVIYSYGIVFVTGKSDLITIKSFKAVNSTDPAMAMVKEADGTFTIWWQYPGNYQTVYFYDIKVHRYAGGDADYFTASTDDTAYNAPVVGDGATLYNAAEELSVGCVHTTGNETIAGAKTFTESITLKTTGGTIGGGSEVWAKAVLFKDNADKNISGISPIIESGTDTELRLYAYNQAQNSQSLRINSAGYVTAPNRAYNASNTSDVVNIALLDAYTPMVRTTGNQNISGVKNINSFFSYAMRVTGTNVYELFRTTLQTDTHVYYTVYTRYGLGMGKLTITLDSDGNVNSMVTDKIVSSGTNDTSSSFFAYKDGSDLVICIGNYSSANNSITITINSLMSGAGYIRSADISNIGTARTPSAISARMLS